MDLRLTIAALEKELGVTLKLIQIPREIMEKNRKGPPPFLEVAVLEADAVVRKANKKDQLPAVDVKLTRFLPSLAEVPSRELEEIKERAIKSGFDFIDFWAVDFDWKPNQPFNHHWQDYRTRKDRSLKTVSEAGYIYGKSGVHTICVKVVDTFGCDTSIALEVNI
jgi:adenine-specific DNA-methyltransferase